MATTDAGEARAHGEAAIELLRDVRGNAKPTLNRQMIAL